MFIEISLNVFLWVLENGIRMIKIKMVSWPCYLYHKNLCHLQNVSHFVQALVYQFVSRGCLDWVHTSWIHFFDSVLNSNWSIFFHHFVFIWHLIVLYYTAIQLDYHMLLIMHTSIILITKWSLYYIRVFCGLKPIQQYLSSNHSIMKATLERL